MTLLRRLLALAALASHSASGCSVLDLSAGSGPAAAAFSFLVQGSGLDAAGLTLELVSADNGPSQQVATASTLLEGGQALSVQVPAGALSAGRVYAAVARDAGGQELCRSGPTALLLAHGGYALSGVELDQAASQAPGPREMNAAGNDVVRVQVTDAFVARDADLRVEYSGDNDGAPWTVVTGARMNALGAAVYVEATTPAVPLPDDYLLACADQVNPVKAGRCVPDLDVQVRVSLDAGASWTETVTKTFIYVAPIRVAFLFKAEVDDFGWSSQINEARVEVERLMGATVDASTYFEDVDSSPDRAAELMRQLCDEDFDLIVPTTYSYTFAMRDMAEYAGCQLAGDGSDASKPRVTYFLGAGTSLTGLENQDRAYGKTLQTRYLAGLVAGYELKRKRAELELAGDADARPCVGFMFASGERGLNAFAIGCREVYADCTVKALKMKDFFDPQAERDAASFMWHVGGCHVIAQHTDSLEPQLVYKELGGRSIGYNYDQRTLLGDSVLASERLVWTPMIATKINQVKRQAWVDNEDLWLGVAEGGVDIVNFSPSVPAFAQQYIAQRRAELLGAPGNDAFHYIFCGPDIKKRYLIKLEEDGRTRLRGCGGEAEYERLADDELQSLTAEHMWTAEGNPLSAGDAITATDCLTRDAVRLGPFPRDEETPAYMDYLVDGIELFDAQTTPYGSVLGSAVGLPEEECVRGLGIGSFVPPQQYPECDGTQWELARGECDPDTMLSAIEYSWVVDNTTGAEMRCGNVADVAGKYSQVAELPFTADGPPCDFIASGSSPSIVGLAFTVVGIVLNLLIVVFLFVYRRNPQVSATQPGLVIGMAFGGVLLCASNLAFIGPPSSTNCVLRVMSFNLAFSALFAILWAKIYRVQRLFASINKLKRVVIKQRDVLLMAAAIVAVDLMLLLIWVIADTPQPVEVRNVFTELPAEGLGQLTVTECKSNNEVFGLLTLFYKVALILSACSLVFASKNVPSSYVEHKFIIFSAYNTAVFAGVVMLLTSSSEDPSTAFIIQSAGTCVGSLIVNGSLSVPRLLLATGVWQVPITESNGTSYIVGASRSHKNNNSATNTGSEDHHPATEYDTSFLVESKFDSTI